MQRVATIHSVADKSICYVHLMPVAVGRHDGGCRLPIGGGETKTVPHNHQSSTNMRQVIMRLFVKHERRKQGQNIRSHHSLVMASTTLSHHRNGRCGHATMQHT